MTFSLLGADPETGEIGVAVQSKFPGVGSIVAHGRAGAGVLATQAFANPHHAEQGLALLAQGETPEAVLRLLIDTDADKAQRQIGIIDAEGRVAQFTGEDVRGWKGAANMSAGALCAAQGNSLVSEAVTPAMIAGFEAARGDLSERLVAGLMAGQSAGGELRGQQSAALLVVKPGGGYGGRDGRHVDISIYDHPEPIRELARCLALHRLSYFPSREEDLREIDADLAAELRALLRAEEFLSPSSAGGAWGEADIVAMARFMGHENYDNRIRDDARIDREVLADIRARRM